MSIPSRLNRRITRMAVGRHLPHRKVRLRLTLLYGGLFLLSGAALLAITYALFVNATGFELTGANGWTAEVDHGQLINLSHRVPKRLMHCVPGCLDQAPKQPSGSALRILTDQANTQHAHVLRYLALESGVALAAMSLLSLGLGWLMAGRVLQPLEDSFQAQRQFVANASHELRAPLTRQRALIQVALADPHASFASLHAAHERVLASEEHLEQMIDGLLALTRGQAGLERREQVDLAALVSQAILAREPQLAGLDLEVRATLARAPTAGDSRLLERLIANLADNAIRHNSPGGFIELTTGTRDRHAFLSISNSGPSVPVDEIDRLFQPFQRLDGARTRHNSGSGLGLSIVRAICDAHRAELSARPRPEGGLTIDVSFPPGSGARSFRPIHASITAPPRTARSRPW